MAASASAALRRGPGLQAFSKVVVTLSPYDQRALTAKYLLKQLKGPKMAATNPKCEIWEVDERPLSRPRVDVTLLDGKTVLSVFTDNKKTGEIFAELDFLTKMHRFMNSNFDAYEFRRLITDRKGQERKPTQEEIRKTILDARAKAAAAAAKEEAARRKK